MIDKQFLLYRTVGAYEADVANGKVKPTSIAFIEADRTIRTQGLIFGGTPANLTDYVRNEIDQYISEQPIAGDKKHVFLTQSEYDALEEYDRDTIYFILESANDDAYGSKFGDAFPFRFGWAFGGEFPIILN